MIKLLTFYSPSHEKMYNDYFFYSYNKFLKESFILIPNKIEQVSKKGGFGDEGFEETMFEKIKHIINNIDVNDESPLVFADSDIQFFGDFKEDILFELRDNDISFQSDIVCACAGFFITKQNKKTKTFFENVLSIMNNNLINGVLKKGISDQIIINHLINNNYPLKFGSLSKDKYFTVASSNLGPKQWNGEDFIIPKNTLVHHANWTVGLDRKFQLLDYVKNNIEK